MSTRPTWEKLVHRMNTSGSGVGLSTLLTIIFVVLKLTHVITWSWWWVFSPLLISGGIGLLILLVMGLLGFAEMGRRQ